MAPVVRIDDDADARLEPYRELRDVALRQRFEAEHGLFIAEGEKVVRRAWASGCQLVSLLMAPRWLGVLEDVLASTDAPCFVADEEVVERITGFHVHRGALAVLARPTPRSVDAVLGNARRLVVLEDLVDHSNVGAVMRSAAALGMDAVLLSPRCADPLYRRAIKVSMGAVFSVPWARIEDWAGGPGLLRQAGFTTLALTPADDAVSLEDVVVSRGWGPTDKVAVVLGTEGAGLSTRWQREADVRVRIPMAAGVDSLNVAAAAAVTFFVLGRR